MTRQHPLRGRILQAGPSAPRFAAQEFATATILRLAQDRLRAAHLPAVPQDGLRICKDIEISTPQTKPTEGMVTLNHVIYTLHAFNGGRRVRVENLLPGSKSNFPAVRQD
jgi:hypothetical protein